MDLALTSILVDIALSVSGWLKQGIAGKKDRKTLELVASLQSLSVDSSSSTLDNLRLVGAMKGALTVPLVREVVDGIAFRGLCQEIFLSELTDAAEKKKDAIRSSMRATFRSTLGSRVNKDHLKQYADFMFGSISETSESWIKSLRVKHPEALSSISTMASARRINATLDAIEMHLSSIRYFDRRPDERVDQELWISKYIPQVINAHGFIQPPDFNNSRKIPIESLYVSPKFIERTDGGENLLNFESLVKSVDRTVILGDPGGGKSTFSAVLAVHAVKKDKPRIIPFHVTLRDFVKSGDQLSIVEFINTQLASRYQCPAPNRCVEALLLSGEALVIFDGLDELIDTTKRRFVTSQVEAFGIAYPLAKVVVTSRRVGYAEAKVDPSVFVSYELGDFNDREVSLYVSKWFESQGEEDFSDADPNELADSFLAQSEAVLDLRKNPLMLSLMCIIFKGENFIPRSRPEVYKKCANLLFEKWDGHRSIEVPLKAKDHIDPAMKFFAHWVLTSNQAESGVPYNLLVSKMTEYLHPRAFNDVDEAQRAAEQFIKFCKGRAWVFTDAGTTSSGESLWKFTHRTFMEYFAAAHLNRIHDTPEKLARELLPRVAAQEWDVIAQLAIQIANDREKGSERALGVMLRERRRRSDRNRSNILTFVARCIDFAVVSEAFVQELTDLCIERFSVDANWGFRERLNMGPEPLTALMENGSRYSHAIQQRILVTLSSRILSNDNDVRSRSAYMMLWCTDVFNLQASLQGRSKGLVMWAVFFRKLAQDHIDILKAECIKDPEMNISLIISDLEAPKAALDRAVASGMELGDLLFSGGDRWIGGMGSSLNGYIIRQVFMQDMSEDLLKSDLLRVAEIFISTSQTYLESKRRMDRSSGSYGPYFVPSTKELPRYILQDQRLLSAVLLSLVAVFESMVVEGFDRTMVGVRDSDDALHALYASRLGEVDGASLPAWFKENIQDEWLYDFISGWAGGTKNIYARAN